jgi:hypothetical protein
VAFSVRQFLERYGQFVVLSVGKLISVYDRDKLIFQEVIKIRFTKGV